MIIHNLINREVFSVCLYFMFHAINADVDQGLSVADDTVPDNMIRIVL